MKRERVLVLIGVIIFWMLLVALSLINEMYYAGLYDTFTTVVLIMGLHRAFRIESIRKRFYKKWHILRGKGRKFNIIRGALISFLYLIVIVFLGQLFANGLTPFTAISALGIKWIWIIPLLLLCSLAIGSIMWYENERKYRKQK